MAETQAATPERTADRAPHVLTLDGLRGFALLMVVLYHVLITNEHAGSRLVTALADVRRSLWIGVDLFIVLSGFLITGILFDSLGGRHFLRNFYARRCLRILPVYWLAVAVLTLLAWHNQWASGAWIPSAGRLLAFLQNTPVWFAHPPAFPLDAFTSHLWSIALEEQFYLVWPLLILLLRDRRRIMGAALLLAAAALLCRLWLLHRGVAFEVTYKMLPCRMDGFLLGGWLALTMREDERGDQPGGKHGDQLGDQLVDQPGGKHGNKRGEQRSLRLSESDASPRPLTRHAPWLFALVIGLLLLAGVHEGGLDWHTSRLVNGPGYTLIALGGTSLLAWTLHPGSLPQTFFQARPLRLLGRYSYGIYVWHVILGQSVTHPARLFVSRFTPSSGLQMLGGACAACAFSLLLGVLSFRAVEIHFLRLKRFVPEPCAHLDLP